MDFSYTEEQQALRELARKILEEQATPERLSEIEKSEEGIDRELWRELAKANLLGAALPEAFGGSGLGFFELCLLLEELGRAVAPMPAWPTLAAAAAPLARFGSPAQQQAWLPGVVSGDLFLSAAFAEAESDDPRQPATRARPDGDGYRLSGTKICVPAAHVAERVLVPARLGEKDVEIFLVDPRAPGIFLETQHATHRERQARLTLDEARVCDADILGEPGAGERVLDWMVERATTALCAIQLGVADRALRMTADYTIERHQFGRPIGSFQAVHQRAADAYIDVEAMRLTLWQAAFRLSHEKPASAEVAIAKYWASEAGHRVAYAAEHLHGGIGADIDYPVHRYYLWARQIELTLGSGAPQLEALGRLLCPPDSEGKKAPPRRN
ncbi:MAG: acyl-CoA dehydrogenase family protein [Myxococcota bacterium]